MSASDYLYPQNTAAFLSAIIERGQIYGKLIGLRLDV